MEIFSCKVDVRRSEVFFKAMQLGCARNRNDPRLLGKQPGKRELSRCRLPLLREFAQQIDQLFELYEADLPSNTQRCF